MGIRSVRHLSSQKNPRNQRPNKQLFTSSEQAGAGHRFPSLWTASVCEKTMNSCREGLHIVLS